MTYPIKKETGEITSKVTLDGNKTYQIRARKAFPLLVRQARAEQPILYSDLAKELDMPNPRNLNFVLGAIGNSIERLSKKWNEEIPPIQCLVINKGTGMPGSGFTWFLKNKNEFKSYSKRQQRLVLKQLLSSVFSFDKWDTVLKEYNLSPVKQILPRISPPRAYRGGGESKEHKQFKEYISKNPKLIGIPATVGPGVTEFRLPSADEVDVLFTNGPEQIGIEVKAKNADNNEITRGLYQCIKYHALIEAMQVVNQQRPNVRTVLALEGKFPKELIGLKNVLGVEVIDSVKL